MRGFIVRVSSFIIWHIAVGATKKAPLMLMRNAEGYKELESIGDSIDEIAEKMASQVMVQLSGQLRREESTDKFVESVERGCVMLGINEKSNIYKSPESYSKENSSMRQSFFEVEKLLVSSSYIEKNTHELSSYSRRRLQQEIHRNVNDKLKYNSIGQVIESYTMLPKTGIILVNFSADATRTEIASSIKNLWKQDVSESIWLIEADGAVDMRDNHDLPISFDFLKRSTTKNTHSLIDVIPPSLVEKLLRFRDAEAQFTPADIEILQLVERNSIISQLIPKNILSNIILQSQYANEPNTRHKIHEKTLQNDQDQDKKSSQFDIPNDTYFQYQWYLNNSNTNIDIRALPAWELLPQNMDSIPIALIDTGVDINHPDLHDALWRNPGEIPDNGIDDDGNGFVDDVHGWNFDGNNNDVSDGNGHGSHTAGLLGAVRGNRVGISGVVPEAKIVVLKFRSYISQVVEAIDYTLDNKIRVSSNSWGYSTYSAALETVIKRTAKAHQLFVCAVDNKGRNNQVYEDYPPNLNYENLLRVASLTSNGRLNSTSNYGLNVDVGAPGHRILSTVPRWLDESGFAYKDGTSMATPLVAGLAGLMLSIKNDLTIYEVKEIIEETTTPLKALKGKLKTGGIINAENSILRLLNKRTKQNIVKEIDITPSLVFPAFFQ